MRRDRVNPCDEKSCQCKSRICLSSSVLSQTSDHTSVVLESPVFEKKRMEAEEAREGLSAEFQLTKQRTEESRKALAQNTMRSEEAEQMASLHADSKVQEEQPSFRIPPFRLKGMELPTFFEEDKNDYVSWKQSSYLW